MKYRFFLLLFCYILSCKPNVKNNDCSEKYKDYNNSLSFLEEYLEQKDTTVYNIQKITDNINLLESISEVNSEIGGEYLGKYRITKNDLVNWKKWLEEKCGNVGNGTD